MKRQSDPYKHSLVITEYHCYAGNSQAWNPTLRRRTGWDRRPVLGQSAVHKRGPAMLTILLFSVPIVVALITWGARILIVKIAIRDVPPKQRAEILRALGKVIQPPRRK